MWRALPLLLVATTVHADPPVTLRLASVAPDGTAWARELKAFARDVSQQTNESLQVKWYLGGIAGDDLIAANRIQKDQLDGLGSGGMLCERVSPIMRAVHMLAEKREESFFVLNRLHKDVEEEMKKSGFVYLGAAGLGPDVVFTREPIRTMDDLKKQRLWVWNNDDVAKIIYPPMGVQAMPMPIEEGYKAYDDRRTDGYIALPAAALAFQWSAQTRYVTDLRMGFVTGCVMVSQRAYDQIPIDARDAFRAAGAKLQMRFEDLGRTQDEQLLHGGLFIKQGLKPMAAEAALRDAYHKAALEVRARLGDKLAPRSTIDRVQALLDEYRQTHK
jgi:TRAP-type C4-dicarboxylate transport system substrate-binding protein